MYEQTMLKGVIHIPVMHVYHFCHSGYLEAALHSKDRKKQEIGEFICIRGAFGTIGWIFKGIQSSKLSKAMTLSERIKWGECWHGRM